MDIPHTAAQLVKLQAAPDLADQVYEQLLAAISQGQLAPGQRLNQEELAEQLAVSRQPVLQALRVLKRDGLVLDAPGRGVQVAPLTSELMRHVYQLRASLDGLAARLAAEQRFQMPGALLKRGHAAAQAQDLAALIEADMQFHQAIYEASGNPLIVASARLNWCHIRRAMGAVLESTRVRSSIWQEHVELAHAIAQGHAEDAARLSSEHAERAGEFITTQLAHAKGDRHASEP